MEIYIDTYSLCVCIVYLEEDRTSFVVDFVCAGVTFFGHTGVDMTFGHVCEDFNYL